jgi:hypothetical protein
MTMRQSRAQSAGRSGRGWNRLPSRLSSRWLLAAVSTLLVGSGFLFLLGGNKVAVIATLVVMAALISLFVLSLALQLAGLDADAAAIADHLAVDPEQRRLLTRWLSRARWARFVGGMSGCVICVLGTRGQSDLLLLGTGGLAVGAMLAELHHVRPRKARRTAGLRVRSVRDYLMHQDARRMVIVGLFACALVVMGIVNSNSRAAVWWGSSALAVLGLARLAQERVASRPRPALSEALTKADDLARELAIGRGLARPATYFALALIARGCYSLVGEVGDLGRTFGGAAWLYAAYLWWHNRRLGLDFLLTASGAPVLA